MSDLKEKKLAFFGIGAMGFGMCYGLYKCGYSMILPGYRKDIDLNCSYNPLVPDAETKTKLYNEMVEAGCVEGKSVKDMAEQADIILISMPKSTQVEELMLGEDGIIENAKTGTVVIDLTSADPVSTKMLSTKAEEKGIEMIDAPVSGGVTGSINQTLSIMVGGKKEVFDCMRPILETIGAPEKLLYIGPSGAGDTIKVCNNFLSACCLAATCEAVSVAVKAGIDANRANEVIANSGGRSDASLNKLPNLVFPGKNFNFTLNLMTKDIGLFNSLAKSLQIPAIFSNVTNEILEMLIAEGDINDDMLNVARKYEQWSGVELVGINK